MAHLNLSPSAIFSPTIARQQLAAAKDWNYIDSWLSRQFSTTGKAPPPFERNPETLKYLLALITLNESADEERELLARVEAKALSDLEAIEKNDPNRDLLEQIQGALTKEGKASLEALSSASVSLGMPIVNLEGMGKKIIDLRVASYDLDQATERVSTLQQHLSTELQKINDLISELRSEDYQAPSEISKSTTEYQRKIKTLASKLPELTDRVSSLAAANTTPITIEDVRVQEEKYKKALREVKELENQVKSYHGLPQDTDLARLEVEALRVQLRELVILRDGMFEGLVARETPRKPRREM